MLTARGWSILVWTFILIAAGMLAPYAINGIEGRPLSESRNTTLEILGLTLGLWFLGEWLLFAVRARIMTRRLQVTRVLLDERGPVDTLWARQTFQVRLSLTLPAGLRFAYVKVDDLVPYGGEVRDGVTSYEGPIEVGQPLNITYRLRCPAVGVARFEGVRVQVADLQGFFYQAAFVHDVRPYRVLPPLTDIDGNSPSVKRHNLLPPPGVHRLRRPGSGSELLDLRDYIPGDPPRTIAWKVSARRDRLITKEFESEVPVRCTLFVDTSNSVRVPPWPANSGERPTTLAQLVEIAGSVAQAAAGSRDLVGLCLFDDRRVTSSIRPARGPRHLVRLIHDLAEAARLTPDTGPGAVTTLLPIAHAFAREVYPELLQRDVNYFPEWLSWLRPPAAYTMKKPTPADRFYQWLPVMMGLYGMAIGWVGGLAMTRWLPRALERGGRDIMNVTLLGVLGVLLLLTAVTAPLMLFPARRRNYRRRKQLAALLAARYDLGPGGVGLLLDDEEHFVRHVQRFLAEHHVPYPIARFDARVLPLLATPHKIGVLAAALLHAVRKGHDNELFVLLVDLEDVAEHIDPLVRAVKVAVARHHRVVVMCPTNVNARLAADEQSIARREMSTAPDSFKRAFARLDVPVIDVRGQESVRLILNRLERLRATGGFRGQRR